MFITINISQKLEGFQLYDNCFYPLYKRHLFNQIDVSKYVKENIDWTYIKKTVESILVNESSSKYSIIVLYDFDMQKRDPLIFSITAILNNLQIKIIDKIKQNFIIDNVYFIVLDDVERDYDGQIIDENLKQNVLFDKTGVNFNEDTSQR